MFAVAFSPDGHTLVTSGADQTLSFWLYDAPGAAMAVCSSTGDPPAGGRGSKPTEQPASGRHRWRSWGDNGTPGYTDIVLHWIRGTS